MRQNPTFGESSKDGPHFCNNKQTTNNKQQTTDNNRQTIDNKQQTTNTNLKFRRGMPEKV